MHTGSMYKSGLPGEKSLGSHFKMAAAELPGKVSALIQAIKAGNAKQASTNMGFVLGELAYIARVADGLQHLRVPLAKLAKKHLPKPIGGQL
jgi:hypothetical protein